MRTMALWCFIGWKPLVKECRQEVQRIQQEWKAWQAPVIRNSHGESPARQSREGSTGLKSEGRWCVSTQTRWSEAAAPGDREMQASPMHHTGAISLFASLFAFLVETLGPGLSGLSSQLEVTLEISRYILGRTRGTQTMTQRVMVNLPLFQRSSCPLG